jgi:predicted negative regulator of RcsB-dependent stress response
MATHLDLEEQEQLDQLKAFWKQYGNLVTWVLIALLGAYAAWNGWNWYQRDQAVKAGAMYDELDAAAQVGDADRASRVFADLKNRYPGTAFAQQGGLLAAKVLLDKGKADDARAALAWVADNAVETEYRTVARLRLAGVLLDAKQYDEALKQLDGATSKEFAGLVADRRGDILQAQGKKDEARAAYRQAWDALDPKIDYRRLVEAKLNVLGVDPTAPAGATGVTEKAPPAPTGAAASGAAK